MGNEHAGCPARGRITRASLGHALPIVVCSSNPVQFSGVTEIAWKWPGTPAATAASVCQGNIKTGEKCVEKGQHFGHRAGT